MLLTAAKVLAEHRDRIAGSIKFVFQPNDEDTGAGRMIAEGVLEDPAVDAAFAFVGTRDPAGEVPYPHHHPRFTFDEKALLIGAELYVRVAGVGFS